MTAILRPNVSTDNLLSGTLSTSKPHSARQFTTVTNHQPRIIPSHLYLHYIPPPVPHNIEMTSSTAIPPGPSSWLPSFDEQVYTLSKVDHIRQYNVPRPDYTIHQEKHLRLLDCLALLLVTQGKSDVAAISFEQTSDCVTLYYAKNRGATRSDREYYRKLVLDAMSPRPDISDALYDRIVHGCVVKIRSRLRKLKGALANARIQVSPEADRTGDFYRHMMKQLPHITSPMTNLIDLLSLIRGMDVNKYPIIGLQNICWASYHIGTYENLHEIIVDSTTLEYLKKIGDYFAAARRIKRHMARLNRGRDPNKRVIIQLKEVMAATSRRYHLRLSLIFIIDSMSEPIAYYDALGLRPNSEPVCPRRWVCASHARSYTESLSASGYYSDNRSTSSAYHQDSSCGVQSGYIHGKKGKFPGH